MSKQENLDKYEQQYLLLHSLMNEPCNSILQNKDFNQFIHNQTVIHRIKYGRGYFAATVGTYYEATGKFDFDNNPAYFYFNQHTGARNMMEPHVWNEIWRLVGDCVENGLPYQQPIVFLAWGDRALPVASTEAPHWIAIRAHILDLPGYMS
jgi:hypothetical protein